MNACHKVGRLVLAVIIALANVHITPATASPLPAFAGYGNENIYVDPGLWSFNESNLYDGYFIMEGVNASARYIVDISDLAAAVDQGGLEINFSVGAYIMDEFTPEELDEAFVTIGFGSGGSGSDLALHTLPRGTDNVDDFKGLSSGASIPSGTRSITVTLQAIQHGGFNSAAFQNPSLVINDLQNPSLSFSVTPAGWTNADEVQVTITASDGDSGVEGIYDEGGSRVGGASYTFPVADNGSWIFTACDYAGKTSAPLTAVVDGIDRLPPGDPALSDIIDTWVNTPLSFELSLDTSGDSGSPIALQYRLDGSDWQAYGGLTEISQEGSTLLEARAIDAAGNSSAILSDTLLIDRSSPQIDLSSTPHTQADGGGATIAATITDLYTNVAVKKYASGSYASPAEFLGLAGGIQDLTGTSIEVAAGGWYTFYAADEAGNEAVNSVLVNTYPTISAILDQSMDEEGTLGVDFAVSDIETLAADLVVNATSSHPEILPNPALTNTDGSVHLDLAPLLNQNGPVTITVTASDAELTTQTSFLVTIGAINDDPVTVDDSAATVEDTLLEIHVLDNDSDVDGDTLNIVSVGEPANGLAVISGAGQTVTYTPDANYTGPDSFTYTVEDAGSRQSTATVNVTVSEVDDPPVLSDIPNQTIGEDSNTGDLPFTFSDVDTSEGMALGASSSDQAIIPDANLTITNLGDGNFTIRAVPLANTHTWNGAAHAPVTITLTGSDGNSTVQQSFTVRINPVNDLPNAVDDTAATNEDTAKVISVLTNDSDIEGEALTVSAVTQPAGQANSVAITGGGQTVTYTPTANFNGTAIFTYTVRDASGDTSTAAVTVTVNSVNDLPHGVNDSATIDEDEVKTLDVLANDTDIDLTTNPAEESLTLLSVSDPVHGSAVISDNKIVYTPEANYSGSDSFTYTFSDADGAESSASVNLTIRTVNDYPVFNLLESEYTVDEDGTITVDFEISDVETPVESLMLQVTSGNETRLPAHRMSLTGLGNADPATSLQLTPAANQNGDVTITLRVGDGFVVTTQTFVLHITPVNDAPVPVNDSISFTEDNTVDIDMDDLVSNDTDIDNDPRTYVEIVAESLGLGTLTEIDAAQHIYRYTPPANFDGSTTFQYVMTDGTVNRTGTVTLTAVKVNDAPTLTLAPGNPTATDEDTPVVLNFSIHDWETTASSLLVQAGSSNGQIVSPTGLAVNCVNGPDNTRECTLTVTPNTDKNTWNGSGHTPVTLTVSVSDGVFLVPQTMNIQINPVQDAPVAVNDAYTLVENGSLLLTPLDNDYDPDGETLQITALETGAPYATQGSLADHGDGTLTYTATSDFTGEDSFAYTISDGLASTQAVVTITVSGENHPPVISNVAGQYIAEDGSTASLAFTATDSDGDALTVTASSSNTTLVPEDADHLLVTDAGSGNYTVRIWPAANQFGQATITLTASDGSEDDVTTTFTVTVYSVNDAPVAAADTVNLNEDTPATFQPLANDSDVENSPLVITSRTDPAHGRLAVSGADFTYTPNSNYHGADSFTYTITDGETTATTTVSFVIAPVNDNPYAGGHNVVLANSTGTESIEINVLSNDGDIDGDTISLDLTYDLTPQHGTATYTDGKITYTRTEISGAPNGADSFTYRIKDSGTPTGYATATVNIATSFAPAPFSISNRSDTFNEDSATRTYSYAGIVGLSILTAPTKGAAVINGTSIEYTPFANANGSDQIQIEGGNGSVTDTAYIYITINPVNDPPTITAVDDLAIDEDTTGGSINVSISDIDGDVAPADLIFKIFSGDESLVQKSEIAMTRVDGDIQFTLTPVANRNGAAVITLLASDSGAQSTESFTLTVNPVNDLPTAANWSFSLNEDSSRTFAVIPLNAVDIDGDALTVSIATPPAHGTATVNPDQTVTYTPTANYFSNPDPDALVYTVSDGHPGGTANGTVTLNVQPVNDPPVISNLAYLHTTVEDTPANVTLTATDVDDQETLVFTFESDNTTLVPVDNISVTGSGANRTLVLQPATNKSGVVVVTVHVSDGKVEVEQDFQLTVTADNDLPVAVDDSIATDEDHAVVVPVISNDSDVEDTALDVATFTNPANGSVVNNRNGTVTYTPNANWNGIDSFTYTVVDDNDGQDTATVTVTVNPVNDAPNAATDAVTIDEDTSIEIDLLANDSDVEDSPLTLQSVQDPANGNVVVDWENGTIVYTPEPDSIVQDVFEYTVSDGELTSTGTVRVTIRAFNDAPRVSSPVAEPWTFNEDTVGDFAIHVYDPETPADNLVIRITSTDQNILPDTSIKLSGSGENKSLQLTPKTNANGTLQINIEATDGVNTTVEVFDVLVASVNDLPTISAVADQTVNEDTATATLSFTVTDVETPAANLTVSAATSNGTLLPLSGITITHAGGSARTVRVLPGSNRVGSGAITLTVTDADGGSADEPFNITVNPVNDAPVAVADTTSGNEDTVIPIDVLANDTDVDLLNEGDTLLIVSTALVNNGSVSIVDQTSLTFTPSANWNGSETFTYTIRDLGGVQRTANVTVTVNPVNDAPTAVDDIGSAAEDHSVTINLIANDTDPDLSREGDDLTILSVAGVDNGSVSISGDAKSITFTPDADWFGSESFTYTMWDGEITDEGAVTVTITPVNDAPSISDVTAQVINEDVVSDAVAFTVNDIDNALATLTVTAASSNGTVIPVGNIAIESTGEGGRTFTLLSGEDENTWNKIAGSHDPVTLTFTVSDGAATASDAFSVTIIPQNDAPDANNDSASTAEDIAVAIDVLQNDDVDLDHEGDAGLYVSEVTQPAHGSVTIAGDGKSVTYTPEAHWSGVDSFTYTALDANNLPDTANVSVTVTQVNDNPVAVDDVVTMNEDASLNILVLANDTDADLTREGDDLTIFGEATSVEHGAVVIAPDRKSLTFIPDPNWNGEEVFSYTVRDAAGAQSTANVTVTVIPVEDDPSAANDSAEVDEDDSVIVAVLTNDSDADLTHEGDVLRVLSIDGVDHGEALISGDENTIEYTPPANWNGSETFTYLMEDSTHRQSSASVTVTVQPVNDAPTAGADTAGTNEDQSVTINVLTNDSDIDLDADLNAIVTDSLHVSAVADPAHGSTEIHASGLSVIYTPSGNWNGIDSFTYTLSDSQGATVDAVVTVTINAINDGPVAVNDSITTDEEVDVTIEVLLNDTDIDLDPEFNHPVDEDLRVSAVTAPTYGEVQIRADGKAVTYSPDDNANGPDSFSYTLEDLGGLTHTAVVSLWVNQINDVPQPQNDAVETSEELAVTIDALANDADADLDPAVNRDEVDSLSLHAVDDPLHGTASIQLDQTIRYTPDMDFTGTDVFNYTVIDSAGQTNIASITVTIGEVINDPPTAVGDVAALDEDGSVTIDVLANDTDIDLLHEGDDLMIVSVDEVDNASVTIAPDRKTLTFTPDANWNGLEVFTYVMEDSGGLQSGALVTVTVNPVNDAPQISIIPNQTLAEDTSSEAVAFTVTDVDNPAGLLTVTAASNLETVIPTANISVTNAGGANRTFTLTPLANKNTSGRDPLTVTLKVSDGSLTSSTTFTVAVTPVNDAPVAANDSASLDEDTSIEIDVLLNDSDLDKAIEGDTLTILSTSGVENATVTIENAGKKLLFTPDANWFGENTFTYTIRDAGGLKASAKVTVTVNDVPEPVNSFSVTAPKQGEAYKDGQTVTVSWTPLAPGVNYTLDFFNGAEWAVLASNTGATRFEHRLENTKLHTDQAYYRVRAEYDGVQHQAVSGKIIIDNRAPVNVILTMTTADGVPYASGRWTNQSVRVNASGGSDLTGIHLELNENGAPIGTLDGQSLVVSQPGEHSAQVIATDPLGNTAVIAELIIRIDNLPPDEPVITQTETREGQIVIQLTEDPGLSGIVTIILPDGTEIPATQEITWTPEVEGEYTFILVDQAGNRRAVKVFAKPAAPDLGPAPEQAEKPAGPGSSIQAQGGLLGGLAAAASSLCLFLLILFFWPNLRLEYDVRQPNGSLKRCVHRRRVFTPKDKDLVVEIPNADSYEVRFSRGLTRSMRGGSLTLQVRDSGYLNANVPENAEGRFSASF